MSARGAASRLHHEEAGFVVSFIVRTVIVFVLLILAAYEIGQIVLADVRSSKAASSAAQAAANTYAATKSYQRAETEALAAAREEDATVEVTLPIKIAKDGSVTVTVTVTAKTLIAGKISFLKHFVERKTTSTQQPGS
jgi:Flp pilus assembly protein TadG